MSPTNSPDDKEFGGRAEDWVEVYHTDSILDAERILDSVLRSEGIEGVIHDRTDHALPAPASQPGTVGIAVAASDATAARELLREAAVDGVLDTGQSFAPPTPTTT